VKKNGVLEEEPGSSKSIPYIRVLYALNTGFARMKPIFFGKNRVFLKIEEKRCFFPKKTYKFLGP